MNGPGPSSLGRGRPWWPFASLAHSAGSAPPAPPYKTRSVRDTCWRISLSCRLWPRHEPGVPPRSTMASRYQGRSAPDGATDDDGGGGPRRSTRWVDGWRERSARLSCRQDRRRAGPRCQELSQSNASTSLVAQLAGCGGPGLAELVGPVRQIVGRPSVRGGDDVHPVVVEAGA